MPLSLFKEGHNKEIPQSLFKGGHNKEIPQSLFKGESHSPYLKKSRSQIII